MNVETVQRFDDGGELTATKLLDFRSRLRPVGPIKATKESVKPILEEISKPITPKKPLRAAIPRQEVSPNKKRPLPELPINEIIEKSPVIEPPLKQPEEKPVEVKKEEKQPEAPEVENFDIKKKVENMKADEPGVFTRSVRAIGNFARSVFTGIRDLFESVFGKLFGRVTKIKIGNQEVVFDGHDKTKDKLKSESSVSLKVELDQETANVMKTVNAAGSIAVKAMVPPPPPPLVDGKIPVKIWREKVKTLDTDPKSQTAEPCLKQIIEKKRREQGNLGLHDDLVSRLAARRNVCHPDDSDDEGEDELDCGFFQVTFTRDDGMQTDLSFDGDRTVEVSTEICDKKSKKYTGLQKKQDVAAQQTIDNGTLAAAFNRLKKAEKKDDQPEAPAEVNLQSILDGVMMQRAAHLFERDE